MKTDGTGPRARRDKSILCETNREKWRAVARGKCVSADSTFDALSLSLSLSLSSFLSLSFPLPHRSRWHRLMQLTLCNRKSNPADCRTLVRLVKRSLKGRRKGLM